MAELLTAQEIREFYDRLLTKPGYIKILKKSLNEIQMDQILNYAEQVRSEACRELDYCIEHGSLLNFAYKPLNFEFPPFPFYNQHTQNFDYTDFYNYYEDKLRHWCETSMTVIKMLEGEIENKDETDRLPPVPEIRPTFNTEAIDTFYEQLKDFFMPEQQARFKEMLTTGNETKPRLLFLDNGNRMADAFKQLYDSDLITGVNKKELEAWIGRNFCYKYRSAVKEYTPRYLNDIISSGGDKCQNPILTTWLNRETGRYLISKA